MLQAAEPTDRRLSGALLPSIGLWLGALVVLILAMLAGYLVVDRLTYWAFAPHQDAPQRQAVPRPAAPYQAETTGSAASTRAEPLAEIDGITGAPLTRLGPAELVSGSDALMHPAPMLKTRPRAPGARR